ncbi:MBL fold metallo-hydrolase [Paucilactobacillus kaifaensis]|uniref:MBL fold metallo-hydrolase n=1 Tax=Paucilactobacillus kaifaensis TaxID=2559921 RepID=UPI0010F72285|nr:MBL fold metallo-hydrolase [Paucilactobacillus kaifaensis]
MKITILGFYGGYPYDNQATSGYLIQTENYNLLLDCGSGVLLKLEQVLDPLQLNAVILSHYHADHIADVGVLQHYWQLNNGIKQQPILPIYGHKEDQANFSKLNWTNATVAKAYDPDLTLKLGPFDVNFLATKHPVTAYAMRFTERKTNHSFVFTADTAYMDALVAFASHADLLITDTNFLAEPTGAKWHLTAEESGRIASEAEVKQLLLSHLPQNIDPKKLVTSAKKVTNSKLIVKYAATGKVIEI